MLIATARNIRHSIDGDDVESEIEAVLTVAERHAEFCGTDMVSTERLETIRFWLTPDAARKAADNLKEWAEVADSEADRIANQLSHSQK